MMIEGIRERLQREKQAKFPGEAIIIVSTGYVSGVITWVGITRFELRKDGEYKRYNIGDIRHMVVGEIHKGGTSGATAKIVDLQVGVE